MEIIIQLRNAQVAEDFKGIVNEKLKALARFNVKMDRVEVEVIEEKNPRQGKHDHKVVITSRGAGPLLRAEAAEFNGVAAFDKAIASFELQIRKVHERAKEHGRDTLRDRAVDLRHGSGTPGATRELARSRAPPPPSLSAAVGAERTG
jgi:ribosomal subunit interface protein